MNLYSDYATWERLVKARNQDIKGEVTLEMRVIIESSKRKGEPVKLDDRLTKAIASIDQVKIHVKGIVSVSLL